MKSFLWLIAVITTYKQATVESCTTAQFQCHSGPCIPVGNRCDNSFDCIVTDPSDTSDEENCTPTPVCPEGGYRCSDGRCVPSPPYCVSATTTDSSKHESSTETSNGDSDRWTIPVIIVFAIVVACVIILLVIWIISKWKKRENKIGDISEILGKKVNQPDAHPPIKHITNDLSLKPSSPT